ncbi:MAG TPA: glycoside hydrolase family 27 protein [Acidimicrobiales bacterium]|nr:glycoside hydrolase family 27 protein [Acidimicrobiales bacterium]
MAGTVWREALAVVAVLVLLAVTTAGGPLLAPAAASAEENGVGLSPAMGWSSWSFLRTDPTAAKVEAEARAMVASGLSKVGYRYVNLDDFWYICPGSQGPAVDRYGRWVPNSHFPPSPNGGNGIEVVADYVHSLGLKFGLYVTPGISKQAVEKNTPILGPEGKPDGYTARQIAEPSVTEHNYNCGGMVGINYRARGAQDFIDSWADEFASWGVDYLKLDGVGSFDIPDVEAWSRALRQAGRPVHLELSNSLNINYAPVWEKYANGWRTGGDIECYSCDTSGTSYPLTDWANVAARFSEVAKWRPFGEPGAFNDYDSIEVGNDGNDGLSLPERQTQLSLWALASSPLILGTDLTHLGPTDLALLEDTAVIAVDQDGVDASRVAETSTSQIFAKTERGGDVVVGLFNTGGRSALVSTTVGKLGMARCSVYEVDDLWSHKVTRSTGTIGADVVSHGVALYRVTGAGGGGRCGNP